MTKPILFRSACSGLWYGNIDAAGGPTGIDLVKIGGRVFARCKPREAVSISKSSDLFKSFEWLRGVALSGNKHAYELITRLELLERERAGR